MFPPAAFLFEHAGTWEGETSGQALTSWGFCQQAVCLDEDHHRAGSFNFWIEFDFPRQDAFEMFFVLLFQTSRLK